MSKIKLNEYCKQNGISYITGYRWFKNGKLPNAEQTPSGTILITVEPSKEENMLQKYKEPSIVKLWNDFFYQNYPFPTLETKSTLQMLDKESAYVVVGALPGFNKDEINIQVEKINQYTILSVEAKHEHKDEDNFQTKYIKEYFKLTDGAEDIKAKYENGVLEITIPKLKPKEDKLKPIKINLE